MGTDRKMTTPCEICADTRLHNLNNLERCDTCAVLPDDLTARHLAAAAPELLAALEAVLEYLEDSPRDYRLQTFGAVWRSARAAIAKATGGEGAV
jgi:hypothetical protein